MNSGIARSANALNSIATINVAFAETSAINRTDSSEASTTSLPSISLPKSALTASETPDTATSKATRRPSATTSPLKMTVDQLRARLEDLPQELCDRVKTLTFEFDFTTEGRCIDTLHYKPPMQLQALRTAFAKQYYGAEEDWVIVIRKQQLHISATTNQWLLSLEHATRYALGTRIQKCDLVGYRHRANLHRGTEVAIFSRDICFKRTLELKNESSCWAWSDGPGEYGRCAVRFQKTA